MKQISSLVVVMMILVTHTTAYKKFDENIETSLAVSTIRSCLRGVGEGFVNDSDYIVADACLNDNLVNELFSIMKHSKTLNGFDKMVAESFYMVRIAGEVYFSCDALPFMYDLLSICFLGRCNMFNLVVNLGKNQIDVLLLSLQFLQIVYLAVFSDLEHN